MKNGPPPQMHIWSSKYRLNIYLNLKFTVINNKMLSLDETISDAVFKGDCVNHCWSGTELDDNIKAVLEIMTKHKANYKFCKLCKTWGQAKNMKIREHKYPEPESIKTYVNEKQFKCGHLSDFYDFMAKQDLYIEHTHSLILPNWSSYSKCCTGKQDPVDNVEDVFAEAIELKRQLEIKEQT